MHKDWLLYRAQNYPDKIFINKKNRSYSFKEVNDIVYDRACSLIDYGVQSKSKVVILISDPLDFIEAYFACYKIGAISIVLSHQSTNSEIEKIIRNNLAHHIICSWKDKSLFKGIKTPIIFFEELSKSHGNCFNKKMDFIPLKEDVQSILFTSGTEGAPKPVCLTYNNFYESSIKWEDEINLNMNDSYMLNLPLYHISGLAIIMRSIHIGFSIKINTDLKKENYDSTILSAVPTLIKSLIDDENIVKQLQLLRCIILSGEKVSKDLLNKCRSLNLNIFLSYGMTETCSSICGFWPFKNNKYIGSVGKAFKGVKLDIRDNRVYIESSTIMKCYLNMPVTAGKIHTNDLAEIKDGYLYLYGRNDNIVISGGKNIDSSEVINVLNKIYNFEKIKLFKEKDSFWGEIYGIHIYTNFNITPKEITEKLKTILSNYKIPKKIIIEKIES